MTWRDTEAYLSVEYLDSETSELIELISIELPFRRVRDGNVTAWILRAEHSGVITTADRVHILAGLRAARERREQGRGAAV